MKRASSRGQRLLPAVILLCATLTSSAAAATTASAALSGAKIWVDGSSSAAQAASMSRAQGDTTTANLLAKLAAQPTAVWLTTSAGSYAKVQSVVAAASTSARVPVFVTYYLPGRDCGGFSAGGAPTFTDYTTWVNGIAAAIGQHPAIVIVEPDAVPEIATGCLRASARSYEVALATEVAILKHLPRASVYLDAGNPNWVVDIRQLVGPLQLSGLAQADGFALNVSNFRTLSDNVSYGRAISASTGGKHFVVDTSRNGLGPLPAGARYPGPSWCNPPGRAVGVPPSTATGLPYVDAYLWVKTPGNSDGSCGLGDPSAGTFWVSYALGLIQRAQW